MIVLPDWLFPARMWIATLILAAITSAIVFFLDLSVVADLILRSLPVIGEGFGDIPDERRMELIRTYGLLAVLIASAVLIRGFCATKSGHWFVSSLFPEYPFFLDPRLERPDANKLSPFAPGEPFRI